MQIVVAYAPAAGQVIEVSLQLAPGATLHDALVASGLQTGHPSIQDAPLGIWGRKAARDQPLRPGDRVEIYRPLRVDPKVARRERFVRQGAGTAGLFAKRRAGAKAGY
ncbi:MAG TPA: RnfH family protein [Curvibacter sp.]|nr:RnfH family protein [Curvibacter sp.]